MSDRRTFLRGLASLPLIGGSVALIGRPTQAAVPVTSELLETYASWLFFEHKLLTRERFGHRGADYCRSIARVVAMNTPADHFHFPDFGEPAGPQPSSRAAVVLSAVGVPLTGKLR